MNYSIGVIIPVYNQENYIQQCYDSLRGQTFQNFEIIFINDGSNDNSINILNDIKGNDDRVSLYSIPNGGVANARNIGLDNAHSDYICFVDPDDFVDEKYLEILFDNLIKNKVDISICNMKLKDEGKVLHTYYDDELEKVMTVYDYMLESFAFETSVCNKLFKKSIINNIRFTQDLTVGEDALFLAEVLLQGASCCITGYTGYIYRYNRRSVMRKRYTSAFWDNIKCWEIIEPLFFNSDYYSPKIEKMFSRKKVMCCISILEKLNKEKNNKYLDEKNRILTIIKTTYPTVKNELSIKYKIRVWLMIYCPTTYNILERMIE